MIINNNNNNSKGIWKGGGTKKNYPRLPAEDATRLSLFFSFLWLFFRLPLFLPPISSFSAMGQCGGGTALVPPPSPLTRSPSVRMHRFSSSPRYLCLLMDCAAICVSKYIYIYIHIYIYIYMYRYIDLQQLHHAAANGKGGRRAVPSHVHRTPRGHRE